MPQTCLILMRCNVFRSIPSFVTVACLYWEKSQRLSSIFDLRKFEKVGPFCKLYETGVDIKTVNSLDNSGSNEIMQKVLALIVSLWHIFQKKI